MQFHNRYGKDNLIFREIINMLKTSFIAEFKVQLVPISIT